MNDTRLPRKFGHYLLLDLLGGGATGTAHLARPLDPKSGLPTPLVVKSVHSALRDDTSTSLRFRHEAMLCVAVDHPNVAKVYEAGSIGDTLYFSMEHVDGILLSKLLEDLSRTKKEVPVRTAVKMIRGALHGLEALHDARHPETGEPMGIVHRDLSPNNLIAAENGQLRVIDLGLGKSNFREWHTRTGAVLGTLGYMPPEQARGERTDRRSDLYAIGVVLWEILMLRRFIQKADRAEMLTAMVEPTFIAPSEFRLDIPKRLDEVIRRAVAVNPDDRFQTARDMLLAIEDAIAHLTHGNEQETFVSDFAWAELAAGRAKISGLLEASHAQVEDGPEEARTVIYAHRRESSAARHEAPTQVTAVKSLDIVEATAADTLVKTSPVTVEVRMPPKSPAKAIVAAAVLLGALAVVAVLAKRDPAPPAPNPPAEKPPAAVVRARPVELQPELPERDEDDAKTTPLMKPRVSDRDRNRERDRVKEPRGPSSTPPSESADPVEDRVAALAGAIIARAELAKAAHPDRASDLYAIIADATVWQRSRDYTKALERLAALDAKLAALER